MASLRDIKKDIDCLVNEVFYDCYLSLYYHDDKRNQIVDIMQEAVDLRNNMIELVNNPAEKKNKSLVKKHYAYIHHEMIERVDDLFARLSDVSKA